ncbi:hypothetical protein [Litchfieldella rifensis]|uniref:Sulfotransferase family protein n=1 Tax=Litchfieldella rifensis TaxID=762643 RepID=A0ABV7LTA9_9GAMM
MNGIPAKEIDIIENSISDALEMLVDYNEDTVSSPKQVESLSWLLNKSDELQVLRKSTALEPIRTIHHFACTGGTLVAKCLASMPNTQLISEVDPLSTLHIQSGKPRFSPTDIISLLNFSVRPLSQKVFTEIFVSGIEALHNAMQRDGQYLILRDHTHSHFCTEQFLSERLTFRAIMRERFSLCSAITVRHPLDSFISLKNNGWIHFEPATLEEYSIRYLCFLKEYNNVPLIKYENFVRSPQKTMKSLCEILCLPYDSSFTETFNLIKLTGDSGRKSEEISERPRREIPAILYEEALESPAFNKLCELMNYEPHS